MKLTRQMFLLFALCFTLVGFGPSGCSNTTLHKNGVYAEDRTLFEADKATTTGARLMRKFVEWEQKYRSTLPPEVSRASDKVFLNGDKWIDSAVALREAYATNPSKENKLALENSLRLIQSVLDEVARYMGPSSTNSPPAELPVKK